MVAATATWYIAIRVLLILDGDVTVTVHGKLEPAAALDAAGYRLITAWTDLGVGLRARVEQSRP